MGGECVISGPRGSRRDAKIAPCSAQDGVPVKRFLQLCENRRRFVFGDPHYKAW